MTVEWTEQALEDAAVMAEFIAVKWTTCEVLRFFKMLAEFERKVAAVHVNNLNRRHVPAAIAPASTGMPR